MCVECCVQVDVTSRDDDVKKENSMQRRTFLKWAAAGSVLPLFNIGCASPRAKTIAAGRRIRVALIGCGLRMRDVLSTKCEDVEIVALVDHERRALEAIRPSL